MVAEANFETRNEGVDDGEDSTDLGEGGVCLEDAVGDT